MDEKEYKMFKELKVHFIFIIIIFLIVIIVHSISPYEAKVVVDCNYEDENIYGNIQMTDYLVLYDIILYEPISSGEMKLVLDKKECSVTRISTWYRR